MGRLRKGARRALVGATVGGLLASGGALAAATQTRQFDIVAQSLGDALREVAKESGLELVVDATLVRGRTAPALSGRLSTEAALQALLAGTDLDARISDGGIVIRGRPQAPVLSGGQVESGEPEILITGSRIRGAPVASPVITVTQGEIIRAGQATLAEAVRAIPQNFGGGVGPGIGVGIPEDNGVNVGSASSINLRGLGADATLTLLNGHRLAYNINKQAIDISSIPLAAVDRLEIVADGASALYGSDAVAGVANIVLKRDFKGLDASVRYGGSTAGGNEQQQYSGAAGTIWSSGGVLVAYDYQRTTAILGRQRGYAEDRPALTLSPFLGQHSVVLTGHQTLGDRVELSLDGLFNDRRSSRAYTLSREADYLSGGNLASSVSRSFVLAPTAKWLAGNSVEISLSGMYGQDHTSYASDSYDGGTLYSSIRGCYCNSAEALELNGVGALFVLPAGSAKLAAGIGYRSNELHAFRTIGPVQDIKVSQDSRFAYAEVNVPVVSAANASRLAASLNVSAAARYEDYPGLGGVTTPKLGVIYEPLRGISLKGSWGRSFKAPTLYQRYNSVGASIYPAELLGSTDDWEGAAAVLLTGGSPDLKPERATTYTLGAAVHPSALPSLTLEAGYFNVRYRARIVAPITFLTQALSNPIYADLVNPAPTATDTEAALRGASVFNYTGTPYDPATVVAIIDDTSRNVARQTVEGVDAAARWQASTAGGGTLILSAAATYIKSSQKLSALQPTVTLAGSIFNPPHVRMRAGAEWFDGSRGLALFGNYLGSISDVRSGTPLNGQAMLTVDVSASQTIARDRGLMRGFELRISMQNVFGAAPPRILANEAYETPYDSTNYTATGRVVSAALSRRW